MKDRLKQYCEYKYTEESKLAKLCSSQYSYNLLNKGRNKLESFEIVWKISSSPSVIMLENLCNGICS